MLLYGSSLVESWGSLCSFVGLVDLTGFGEDVDLSRYGVLHGPTNSRSATSRPRGFRTWISNGGRDETPRGRNR